MGLLVSTTPKLKSSAAFGLVDVFEVAVVNEMVVVEAEFDILGTVEFQKVHNMFEVRPVRGEPCVDDGGVGAAAGVEHQLVAGGVVYNRKIGRYKTLLNQLSCCPVHLGWLGSAGSEEILRARARLVIRFCSSLSSLSTMVTLTAIPYRSTTPHTCGWVEHLLGTGLQGQGTRCYGIVWHDPLYLWREAAGRHPLVKPVYKVVQVPIGFPDHPDPVPLRQLVQVELAVLTPGRLVFRFRRSTTN